MWVFVLAAIIFVAFMVAAIEENLPCRDPDRFRYVISSETMADGSVRWYAKLVRGWVLKKVEPICTGSRVLKTAEEAIDAVSEFDRSVRATFVSRVKSVDVTKYVR
jgi:hypothetical protein